MIDKRRGGARGWPRAPVVTRRRSRREEGEGPCGAEATARASSWKCLHPLPTVDRSRQQSRLESWSKQRLRWVAGRHYLPNRYDELLD
jgi:hypothetical protein